ncbi:type II toxin-antitoxin system RelE/ParE family toxin [Desulfovibrio aminophilus]|jgi:mRNA interferase RelE/StbE|nr:type II toxin-antitoxin system RelE/ParE family toxin [Desulfovibrio aminophilus]MCM0753923.1 type II toxin-antitoxin system RelE/ParE family toxin [Desulfovibrio aminophilus]
MAYTIELSPLAARELKKIPRQFQEQVSDAIDLLEENPRRYGVEKLTAKDAYRFRSGDYRILFQINDGKLMILVLRIVDRREAYKKKR